MNLEALPPKPNELQLLLELDDVFTLPPLSFPSGKELSCVKLPSKTGSWLCGSLEVGGSEDNNNDDEAGTVEYPIVL